MRSFQKLHRDESGMSYVFIGMGLMAFLGASMLAIDVGMLMTARAQAQNSADAGALAGALALARDDWDDRTATGPAVRSAIMAAQANDVMHKDVSVLPTDVEFPTDPAGVANRVRVTVYRRAARGNAVSTLVARYFGVDSVDIAAVATAEVSPANAMSCVKPFTIPDKWREVGSPPWDPDDTYDAFDKKGNPIVNGDVYVPADEPGYTGYDMERDKGTRLLIRAGTGNNITPSFYFSLALNGETGGAEYRWNIANCNTTIMRWGEPLIQEPGNMMGPTVQGIEALIALDPGAQWDEGSGSIRGSAYDSGRSPRVFPIPLYDPEFYDSGKRNGRVADLRVANWIGFFAEEAVGNNIYGRIYPIGGIRERGSDAPTSLFPKAIRLVQ